MRRIVGCRHSQTLTTITAGLARTVCETCGQISVAYVEQAVRLFPQRSDMAVPAEFRPHDGKCGLCSQTAEFMTPDGVVCSEHAWQAAARSSWGGGVDPWVPIPLDASLG